MENVLKDFILKINRTGQQIIFLGKEEKQRRRGERFKDDTGFWKVISGKMEPLSKNGEHRKGSLIQFELFYMWVAYENFRWFPESSWICMSVPQGWIRGLGVTFIKLIDKMKVSMNFQWENDEKSNIQFKKNFLGKQPSLEGWEEEKKWVK